MKLIIRQRARSDPIDIHLFLRAESEPAAHRFLLSFRETCRTLADMPGIGRFWDRIDSEIRDVRVWRVSGFERYLIFYRATTDTLDIARILHGSRDLDNLLLDESAE